MFRCLALARVENQLEGSERDGHVAAVQVEGALVANMKGVGILRMVEPGVDDKGVVVEQLLNLEEVVYVFSLGSSGRGGLLVWAWPSVVGAWEVAERSGDCGDGDSVVCGWLNVEAAGYAVVVEPSAYDGVVVGDQFFEVVLVDAAGGHGHGPFHVGIRLVRV